MNDTGVAAAFLTSRDFILKHRTDYDAAVRGFAGRLTSTSTGRSTTSMRSRPATIVLRCTLSKKTARRRSGRSRNCRRHRIASPTSCAASAHGAATACC